MSHSSSWKTTRSWSLRFSMRWPWLNEKSMIEAYFVYLFPPVGPRGPSILWTASIFNIADVCRYWPSGMPSHLRPPDDWLSSAKRLRNPLTNSFSVSGATINRSMRSHPTSSESRRYGASQQSACAQGQGTMHRVGYGRQLENLRIQSIERRSILDSCSADHPLRRIANTNYECQAAPSRRRFIWL